MPSIQIKLQQGGKLTNVPLAVEVVGSDLESKWKGPAIGGTATTRNLSKGLYSIQVTLPSGQIMSRSYYLKGRKPGLVELNVASAPQDERLEWASLTKPSELAAAEQRETQLRSVWLRLWGRLPDGPWAVQPWPVQMPVRKPGLVQYEFHFRSEGRFGQYYLQVGGPTMQCRLVSLPADDIRVLITGADIGTSHDEADSVVDVSVGSMDQQADVLLRYLSHGEIDRARTVSTAVVAEELLMGKHRNPIAAAIAGYYLLQIGDLDHLNDVLTNNLADWMEWLPDGAVIDAWNQLRRKPSDFTVPRRRLIEAAARGVPVYARGLRLLVDGLSMFSADPDQGGPDVDAALQRVRRYAGAADWSSDTTTFTGRDPNSPGKAPIGMPDNPSNVIFLASPGLDDLEWITGYQVSSSAQNIRALSLGFSASLPETASIPEMDAPPASDERMLREALGEKAAEIPGLESLSAPDPAANDIFDADAERRYKERKEQRRKQVHSITSGQQYGADTPERTLARLLSAASSQTQTEQLLDLNPVKIDAEHPLHLRGMAVERVVGLSDLLSVHFLERGLAAAQTVGRVVVRNTSSAEPVYATGFLVSPRHLLTCHHVLPSAEVARLSSVDFNYQDGPDGHLLPIKTFRFDPDTFFRTDSDLDITIVAVSDEPGRVFGWNHLVAEPGKAIIGEYLSLIQHAKGAPKQVAIRESQLIDVFENFVHCHWDTCVSSSGAPLFNDQWVVVGMHHASIPERNKRGHTLDRKGEAWSTEKGKYQIRWAAHEAVRVSSIVGFLKALDLSESASDLRDEVLFLKPPPLTQGRT